MPYLVNGRIPKPARKRLRSSTVGVRGRSALSVANQALRAVRTLKNDEELKYFPSSTGFTPALTFSSAGYILHMPQIAGGTGRTDRIGNKITIKRIQIKGKLMVAELSNMTWRVLVVRDRQQIVSYTPAITDVLVSARTNSMLTDDTQRPARFQILSDRTYVQNCNFMAQDMTQFVNIDLKKLNIDEHYNDAGASTQTKNGVYLIVLCDYSTSTAYSGTISASTEAAMDLNYLVSYTDA